MIKERSMKSKNNKKNHKNWKNHDLRQDFQNLKIRPVTIP
jgi:hypothetical protein